MSLLSDLIFQQTRWLCRRCIPRLFHSHNAIERCPAFRLSVNVTDAPIGILCCDAICVHVLPGTNRACSALQHHRARLVLFIHAAGDIGPWYAISGDAQDQQWKQECTRSRNNGAAVVCYSNNKDKRTKSYGFYDELASES